MIGKPRERRGTRAAAIAVVVLATAAAMPVRGAELVDRVIAVVSGSVIMLSDARAAMALGFVDTAGARDPVETAMRWLVDRQLVLDEATRSGDVEVDAATLAQALEGARARFVSEREYRAWLASVGLAEPGLERLVRDTLLVRQYVESRFDSVLPATDEELREFYGRHAGRFVRGGRQLTYEDALEDVRAAVQQQRRQQAVSTWMDRLRRRADINEVYAPSR